MFVRRDKNARLIKQHVANNQLGSQVTGVTSRSQNPAKK